jgi:hypothetical protein
LIPPPLEIFQRKGVRPGSEENSEDMIEGSEKGGNRRTTDGNSDFKKRDFVKNSLTAPV